MGLVEGNLSAFIFSLAFLNQGQKKEKAKKKKIFFFKVKMGLDFEEKKLVQI